ncbi:Orn/Lys/Arg family decarboxylase [Actinomadura chokoriensis]
MRSFIGHSLSAVHARPTRCPPPHSSLFERYSTPCYTPQHGDVTPYPPGIPAVLPGERITPSVMDYLRTGVDGGMVIPDGADPSVKTVRVLVQDRCSPPGGRRRSPDCGRV